MTQVSSITYSLWKVFKDQVTRTYVLESKLSKTSYKVLHYSFSDSIKALKANLLVRHVNGSLWVLVQFRPQAKLPTVTLFSNQELLRKSDVVYPTFSYYDSDPY